MDPWIVVISSIVGYFVGAVSFTRLVTHIVSPTTNIDQVAVVDNQTGESYSRAANATTASMALGWKVGCLVSGLDMLKITIPTLVFKLLFPDQYYYLFAAGFGLLGNNWPIYYRFKGGTGISAIYGGLLVVDPLAVIVTPVTGFILGLVILRSYAVAFVLSLLLIIPWLWLRFHQLPLLIYGIFVNLVYLGLFARDVKDYLRPGSRRMSEKEVMEQMPMGRGMLKMMRKLGLDK